MNVVLVDAAGCFSRQSLKEGDGLSGLRMVLRALPGNGLQSPEIFRLIQISKDKMARIAFQPTEEQRHLVKVLLSTADRSSG
jgi:hypothetical protein